MKISKGAAIRHLNAGQKVTFSASGGVTGIGARIATCKRGYATATIQSYVDTFGRPEFFLDVEK
jgi:hypothetical protein